MALDMDKMMDRANRMADGAVNGAKRLVKKGKRTANRLALQNRLAKMYRQLGALCYTQQKTGDSDGDMLAWYVSEIDRLKAQILTFEDPEPEKVTIVTVGKPPAEGEEDAMFCDCGGH